MVTKRDWLARSRADLLNVADDLLPRGIGHVIQSLGRDPPHGG
jgi:hypothetical protein